MRRKLLFILCISVAFQSCRDIVPKGSSVQIIEDYIAQSPLLENSFTGIVVLDAESGTSIFEQNAGKYFTPASNTKLYTFYSSLLFLKEEIPTLDYLETDSSFIFWGTGDPTFLHRAFKGNKAYNFLKNQSKPLVFSTGNFFQKFYGQGWSWDDYNDYYQVENTSFPIYGNTVEVDIKNELIRTDPPIFVNTTFAPKIGLQQIERALSTNEFFIPEELGTYSNEVPIKTSELMTQQLLMDTLKRNVEIIHIPKPRNTKTFYGYDTKPVLLKMMKESDNFLAEQLLILCSSRLSDSLSNSIPIDKIKSQEMTTAPHSLKWVDGSGLSRYNLFTPATTAHLLFKMRNEFGEERIFPFLPKNGENGSTLGSFENNEGTYLYAKSGTLTGVYNLSGYITTKSGKTLIVSCMHNNFNKGASEFRKWTEDLYGLIYKNY